MNSSIFSYENLVVSYFCLIFASYEIAEDTHELRTIKLARIFFNI